MISIASWRSASGSSLVSIVSFNTIRGIHKRTTRSPITGLQPRRQLLNLFLEEPCTALPQRQFAPISLSKLLSEDFLSSKPYSGKLMSKERRKMADSFGRKPRNIN